MRLYRLRTDTIILVSGEQPSTEIWIWLYTHRVVGIKTQSKVPQGRKQFRFYHPLGGDGEGGRPMVQAVTCISMGGSHLVMALYMPW